MDFDRFPRTLALVAVLGMGCAETPAGPTSDPLPDGSGEPAPAPAVSGVGRVAFVSTRDGDPHIYLIDPDGTGLTRLVRGESPAWSPDGRTIAFQVYEGSRYEVRLIDVDGSSERLLAVRASDPVWSPDGRRVAFARSPDLHAVNADGTGESLLVTAIAVSAATGLGGGPASDLHLRQPVWSADGGHLALAAVDGWSSSYLLIAEADGSGPRMPRGIRGSAPAWSPDGARLAYARPGGLIASMGRDGSDGRIHAFLGDSPDWSSDGTNLVYASVKPHGCVSDWEPCSTRIWVGDPRDDSRTQLVPDAVAPSLASYSDYDPAWSRERE